MAARYALLLALCSPRPCAAALFGYSGLDRSVRRKDVLDVINV
jgi:hypothetical protein